ncbi:HAD-IA family hydrolase [Lutibaculum baratangense]|uniref:Phosphoglycolate phosphatase n=1 Tax=Lutibaculum baratangense AMV1 TaxID=631454 RepID=V4QT31_9HYPH|nr:HAD-IA family hydrolase [Lutibaculum baratangense]ESR22887.1 Phosphoglycolate phosphatase [Lutibaculum baratangense AMV1]
MPAATVVFDLDGTLVDTAPDLLATLDVVLEEAGFGRPHRPHDIGIIGRGSKAMIAQALEPHGVSPEDPRIEPMHLRFLQHYERNIAVGSAPYPGCLEALDRLASAGVTLAVCTNKLEGLSRRLLDALGLADRFAAIVGADTLGVRKPDAGHVLGTIARAGGDPARAVMVGDSRYDILGAQNAGVPVVAFDFGYTETPVEAFDPDRVISHYDELWDAVAPYLRLEEEKA